MNDGNIVRRDHSGNTIAVRGTEKVRGVGFLTQNGDCVLGWASWMHMGHVGTNKMMFGNVEWD